MQASRLTTVPPGVSGRVKGGLVVQVDNVEWQLPKRRIPHLPYLIVRWWGDPGPGVSFPAKPREALQFPVCCGSKYLSRYFRDMASMTLVLMEFLTGEVLGQATVDVRYLDEANPIRGTFPATTLSGHHAAQLSVTLEVRYDLPAPPTASAASFQRAEQQVAAGRGGGGQAAAEAQASQRAAAGGGGALSAPKQPPAHAGTRAAAGFVAAEGPSDGGAATPGQAERSHALPVPGTPSTTVGEMLPAHPLELFEALHTQLSRNVDGCVQAFSTWESTGASSSAPRTLHSLLQLFYDARILDVPLEPDQATVVQLMLDPAGDVAKDMAGVLLAIREAQEAALRVRASQLAPLLPQLTRLVLGLQQRRLSLRAAFQAAAAGGRAAATPHLTLNQLVEWCQKELPRADRQLLRYLLALVLHVREGPLGFVSLQDLEAVQQLVLGGGEGPPPEEARQGGPGRPASARQPKAALQHLKRRTSRPVRDMHAATPSPTRRGYGSSVAVAATPPRPQPAAAPKPARSSPTSSPAPRAVAAAPPAEQLLAGTDRVGPSAGGAETDAEGGGSGDTALLHDQAPPPQPSLLEGEASGEDQDDEGEDEAALLQQLLQDAQGLRSNLDDALAAEPTSETSGETSPQTAMPRARWLPRSHVTAETLAALEGVPPEVVLDLLGGGGSDDGDSDVTGSSPPRRAVGTRAHRQHTTRTFAADRHGRSPVSDVSASPEGSFLASPNAMSGGAEAGSSGAEDGWDERSGGTDGRGAAAFAEQHLLQQLFYAALDERGTRHAGPSSPPSPARHSSPDLRHATASGSDSPGALAASQPPGRAAGDEQQGSRLQLSIHSLVLDPAPGLHDADAGAAQGEVVVKARASCCPVQRVCALQARLGDSPAGCGTTVVLSPPLTLWLPAAVPAEPLSAPPAVVLLEVWRLPPVTHPAGPHVDPIHSLNPNASVARQGSTLSARLQGPGAALLGIAHVPLRLSDSAAGPEEAGGQVGMPAGAAVADGEFPITDVLGEGSELGRVRLSAALVGCPAALVRHTWRVTLCGATGLPHAAALATAGLPAPAARYVTYLYPGERSALVTEEVPPTDAPIFAATALHSIVLPGATPPTEQLLLGDLPQPPAQQAPQLVFEVWDRWGDGVPDTCVGTCSLPLRKLLAQPPGGVYASALLPLALQPASCEARLLAAAERAAALGERAAAPLLEIRLQAECMVLGPAAALPAMASPPTSPSPPARSTPPAAVVPAANVATPHEPARPVTAVLHIDVGGACGLQAAVLEASAWLGGGSALLGRAQQLGPHPFVVVNLFPAEARLAERLPPLRTPFQAQAFCPRYDWHAEVPLELDAPVLAALLTQQLCVEVWHHPSRSLAAMAAQSGSAGTGQGPEHPSSPGAVLREVLLGSGACALDKLLLRPQGIQTWVHLRSARGQAVGAVQLSARLALLDGRPVDTCLAAPAPLDQAPGLLRAVPGDVAVPRLDVAPLQGQWCRATLYIDHAALSPPALLPPGPQARLAGRQHVFYATYRLPGSDVEVTTKAQRPAAQTGSGADASSRPATIDIPLQHVGVHWVQGDGRLAGALARCPLRIQLWRAHERPPASSPAGPLAGPSPPWLSTQLLGSVEVDASPLVLRPPGSKQLPARWLSGTHQLIDPTATCHAPASLQVKFLLELSPPVAPAASALAGVGAWQPADEFATPNPRPPTPPSVDPALSPPAAIGQSPAPPVQGSPPTAATLMTLHPGPALSHGSPAWPGATTRDGTERSTAPEPHSPRPRRSLLELQEDLFSIKQDSGSRAAGRPAPAPITAHHPLLGSSSASRAATAAAPGTSTPLQAEDARMEQHVNSWPQRDDLEDPAALLRLQLQELDVMTLQWARRGSELSAWHHDGPLDPTLHDSLSLLHSVQQPSSPTPTSPSSRREGLPGRRMAALAFTHTPPHGSASVLPAAVDIVHPSLGAWGGGSSAAASPTAGPQHPFSVLEVCSDDGGGDVHYGGYSGSEDDVDALLADIPVLRTAYSVGSSNAGDLDHSHAVLGVTGGTADTRAAATAALGTVVVSGGTVLLRGSPQDSPRHPGAAAGLLQPELAGARPGNERAVAHDEEWMFTFSKRPVAAAAMPASSGTLLHPGMSPHQIRGANSPARSSPTSLPPTAVPERPAAAAGPSAGTGSAPGRVEGSTGQPASRPQGSLQSRLDALLLGFQTNIQVTGEARSLGLSSAAATELKGLLAQRIESTPAPDLRRRQTPHERMLLLEDEIDPRAGAGSGAGIVTVRTCMRVSEEEEAGGHREPGHGGGQAPSAFSFSNSLPPMPPDFAVEYS